MNLLLVMEYILEKVYKKRKGKHGIKQYIPVLIQFEYSPLMILYEILECMKSIIVF